MVLCAFIIFYMLLWHNKRQMDGDKAGILQKLIFLYCVTDSGFVSGFHFMVVHLCVLTAVWVCDIVV